MKRITGIALAVIAIAVSVGATYAALSLTVNNTATIIVGDPNLQMVTGMTASATCTASSGSYSDTGLQIAWGNMKQAAVYHQYVCIRNTGVSHVLAITTTLQVTQGVFTATISGSDANGQTLTYNGYALMDFAISVPATAPTGTVIFDINIG